MNEPVKVHNWPMGYCDNGGGHFGEHPLYTSSDGGCINFVTSERLLEIKQLFDAVEENEALKAEIEDFYRIGPKIEFDNWLSDDPEYDDVVEDWYSAEGGMITSPAFFYITKFPRTYRLMKIVNIGVPFSSLEEAQKFAEDYE